MLRLQRLTFIVFALLASAVQAHESHSEQTLEIVMPQGNLLRAFQDCSYASYEMDEIEKYKESFAIIAFRNCSENFLQELLARVDFEPKAYHPVLGNYLHSAAGNPNATNYTEELVEMGVEIELKTMKGDTPLTIAVLGNDPLAVRKLLELGSSYDVRVSGAVELDIYCDHYGQTIGNEACAMLNEWKASLRK